MMPLRAPAAPLAAMDRIAIRLLSPLLLLAAAAAAVASDRYVAIGGDDSGPGTLALPWATLQHAVDSVAAGDTIWVRGGTYAGFRIEIPCTQAAHCSLRPLAGEAVLVDGPGPRNQHQSNVEVERFGATITDWTIEGLEVAGSARYGVDLRDTQRITVRGCRVHDSALTGIFLAHSYHPTIEGNESSYNGEHGIYHSNSGDFPLIRGNRLHHNAAAGLHMNADLSLTPPGDGIITNALVERNVIWENGAQGGAAINCDGVTDSIFRNNLAYANHASGITLFAQDGAVGSSRDLVYNNTFVMAPDARWVVLIPASPPGVPDPVDDVIRNNILYTGRLARGSIAVYDPAAQGFVSDDNAVVDRFSPDGEASIITLADWQALGHDLRSFVSDPASLFVDPASGDYRLRDGSPAIDAGASLSEVTDDLLGSPRPSGSGYDIGCYEVQPAVAGPVRNLRFRDATALIWEPAAVASAYDVLRGRTLDLRADLGIGRGACLAEDLPSPLLVDPEVPPSGEGFYYLVRGDGTGVVAGTYDSPASEGRDAQAGSIGGRACEDSP